MPQLSAAAEAGRQDGRSQKRRITSALIFLSRHGSRADERADVIRSGMGVSAPHSPLWLPWKQSVSAVGMLPDQGDEENHSVLPHM